MPPNASDTYVIPKPEKEWPAEVKSKEDIIRRIEETMKPLIGNRTEIQQPIQMRFNELIAGVRADVAVKLYGDDLDQMTAQGQRIAAILRKIPARVTSAWSRPRRSHLRRPDRPHGGGAFRPFGAGDRRYRGLGAGRASGGAGV
jgi:Cu/Ag efflux pump CusA